MSFFNEWMTNIILFILIAIIIDLLLPNSSMQKYVKMVVSLLLIAIILTPLFQIFSINIDQALMSINLSPDSQEKKIENLIEMKKKEIQASQRAYILEQTAVQMKLKVEEELVQKYGLLIQDIAVNIPNELENENLNFSKDVSSVEVIVAKKSGLNETISEVKSVTIDTSKPIHKKSENHLEDEVTKYLALKWEIDLDKLVVLMEGGREESNEK